MPIPKIKEPRFIIGVDTYDKKNNAYCLTMKFDKTTFILLSKTIRDENEFQDEVENLQKYFDATIIKEIG